jgi:hypothetical protein
MLVATRWSLHAGKRQSRAQAPARADLSNLDSCFFQLEIVESNT